MKNWTEQTWNGFFCTIIFLGVLAFAIIFG